jgi:2-polyprenyl-3-methyl-5-hydroxy-6-metoxy-1,4-benzoquinol methylase
MKIEEQENNPKRIRKAICEKTNYMEINTIDYSVEKIFLKIKLIDLQDISISDHTRDYLKKYRDNDLFYISTYSQLLKKAIIKLKKPLNESTFIDYGGGCGIQSFIAKELGFRTIVYNDIYMSSVTDTKIIAQKLNMQLQYYFLGDIDDLINNLRIFKINPDLICSLDVLEHIYDLECWIKSVSDLNSFSLLFMTGANPKNLIIVRRLKKIHKIAEYKGCEKNIRINDKFLNVSLLQQRSIIIKNQFSDLSNREINLLARETRGLMKHDIEKIVAEYIKTRKIAYKIKHPTNTCDPYNGNWTEKLIDLKQLKKFAGKLNLKLEITNSLYSYSENKFLNAIKFFLNQLIKLFGPYCLFLSPTITLEIHKE